MENNIQKRIAVVTSSKIPDLLSYDREILNDLNKLGFVAEKIIWDDESIDITKYDIFLMRTAWDYYLKPNEFKSFINSISASNIPLFNSPEIIINNMHKFYLKELESNGIEIIPTIFKFQGDNLNNSEIKNIQNWREFIVKPAVSAGSYKTMRFNSINNNSIEFIDSLLTENDILIQKFIDNVEKNGEYSSIFFNNGYSYCVQKIPRNGDYRVQKDYGGKYYQVIPNEIVKNISSTIAGKYLKDVLYVRVDGIFDGQNFLLMEIEMIEPDLYLDIVPNSKEEFLKSFLSLIDNLKLTKF